MNERIQELMNQAMESTGTDGIGGPYMELNPEKFAKLIVQECAMIYEKIDNGNLYEGTDDYMEALCKLCND